MIVYCVTNSVDGTQYVGITTRGLSHRKYGHKKAHLDGTGGQNTIYQAYRDFGWDAFNWRILEKVKTVEDLRQREIFWIKKLKTLRPNGYNQNRGGSCTPADDKMKKYVVEGKAYYGFGQLADAYGLPEITVLARINRQGWTVEQAVGLEPKPKYTRPDVGNEIEFRGIVYESQRELCREYNICYNMFRQRYCNLKWSLEEALGIVERVKSRHEIFVFGKVFKSISSAAEFYGVKRSTVTSRLHYGWTLERALSCEILPNDRPKPFNKYYINGVMYQSYKEIANAFGLTESAVRGRIFRGSKKNKTVQDLFGG